MTEPYKDPFSLRTMKRRGKRENRKKNVKMREYALKYQSARDERARPLIDEWRFAIWKCTRSESAVDGLERLCDEIPVDVRRACLGQPCNLDPIWPLAERLRALCGPLTLDIAGCLYGLTRERIRQIEVTAMQALQQPMANYRDFEHSESESPMAIIEGGVW